MIIPDDLSARLSVAEGLIGASDDEWLDYCGMFARAARPVKLSQCTDYKGLLFRKFKLNNYILFTIMLESSLALGYARQHSERAPEPGNREGCDRKGVQRKNTSGC